MKHNLHVLLFVFLLSLSFVAIGQSPTVCPINAGADQTICVPNCATLTGTFVPTNQTNTYLLSTIPYAPDPFNVGTSLFLSDDQWSQVIPLPFTFCFYGNPYNSCLIGSNGMVSFSLTGAGGYCQWPISTPVPSGANPMNTIMGPWQDLYPPAGGTIKYSTYGTAPCRRFVVSWNQLPMYACTSTLCTQQVTIYETTNIIDNYIQTKPTCGWNGGRAIEAIHNINGTLATVVPGRNSPSVWTTINDGKRYTPNGASTCVVGWYLGPVLITNNATTVVCPTATTTYTFQATYTNCNSTTVIVSDPMTVNVSALVTSAGVNQNICVGGCANLNCVAVGATSYSWVSIPGNINVGNTAAITVCPLVTTTYVVTANSNSCAGLDTVVVNVTAMTTASAGADDSICSGACATLQGSGGVSYVWAPAASIVGSSTIANPQACPLTTTTFTVTVTDANGCIGTDQVTVFVAPSLLSLNITPTSATCFGYCNGSATSSPVGGFPPYNYLWSNAQTTATGTNLCAGQITLTVTDAIGCTSTASVILTQPTAIAINATLITTANCGQNDGTVTIAIAGGTPGPGYTILWPSSGNNGLTEMNLPPGQVCVYVYDANGCGDTLCVTVPNTPGAVVNVNSFTNVTCNGACDGTATAIAIGGTGPYSYSWNTAPAQLTITATPLCPGNYLVTMIDANGCSDTTNVLITEPPVLTNLASGTITICIGQTANLTSVASGGTPIYNYSWTDGITNWSTANIAVSPTVTTTYTVSLTDANGCVAINQTITVTVNPPLNVVAMAGISVCANSNVNITALANGGNGNITYTWQPGNLIGASINIPIAVSTTYTVTATDGCGTPSSSDTVTVMVNPLPIVTIVAATATSGCQPLCVTFTNNTPNTNSIAWTFGNNLGNSISPNPTFCFSTFGIYDVSATVTDNLGCVGTTTLTNYITVWPLPNALFSATPQPATVLDNSVTFTDLSSGANAWAWSFGADLYASTLQNPMYAFQDSGVFAVQLLVTNQYGCQDSITMPILIKPDYALYIPNAFTPNGDNINDLFFPLGMGVSLDKYMLYIFDRWGNIIFNTDNTTVGWDGTVQGTGRLCQLDTYVYKITAMDPDGALKVYIGQINLIR